MLLSVRLGLVDLGGKVVLSACGQIPGQQPRADPHVDLVLYGPAQRGHRDPERPPYLVVQRPARSTAVAHRFPFRSSVPGDPCLYRGRLGEHQVVMCLGQLGAGRVPVVARPAG